MKHVIIGTAGHIDHGKSSLVLALTGTDPDRLQEEKARGITIDLGFAHTIERDIALSFVDVPGHERFIRNMLAGVGGMDLVMLHVAADESVMPQTREHFEICQLLHVPSGLVVLTKADLVDEDTLDVVRLEIQDLVTGSFLEGAPVLAVSARTGTGLPDLRRTLAELAAAASERPAAGPPRLPIDRVFSMRGFGTVVTGTLTAGRIGVDDELVLLPSGRTVKVRGVQVHGETRREATAGQRTAVNLAGVDVSDVARGETLTVPDAVLVTRHADVRVELLHGVKPLRHGARVRFHQGTRELLGRVALAGGGEVEAGADAFARVHLEAPAALRRGDRFILRAYSPLRTIGGGTVLDPLPPRRGVRTAAGLARFARIANLAPESQTAALAMIEEAGLAGLPVAQLIARAGTGPQQYEPLMAALERTGQAILLGSFLVSSSHLDAARQSLLAIVTGYHAKRPIEEGIAREELRERVCGDVPVTVFEHLVTTMVTGGQIVARDRVALAGRSMALTDQEVRARDTIAQILHESGLTPPDPAALASRVGIARELVDRMATLLIRQKVLVRLGDLLFHESALSRLKADIGTLKQQGTVPMLDVAVFKDRYQMTRKHAIPLLEFLDREHVTRRVGNTRKIL
jgi:selenocysteine-specific elongation factor